MMMRSIFLRTLYDKRWFTLGWALSLGLMAVLMVAMFPSLRDSMAQIANNMPQELRGLIGDSTSFTHLDSYLSSQLYDIRIPLFLMIMAVVVASGVLLSFEEKGALRTVLAGASSRASWYSQTWAAVLIIFIVSLLVTATVTAASVALMHETIGIGLLAKLALISLSFAMCVFTIVFSLGAITGSRTLPMAAGIGLIIISFILEAGRAVDWLEPFQKLSLLHYYDASKLVGSGISVSHQLIILGITVAMFVIGLVVFRRRDLS